MTGMQLTAHLHPVAKLRMSRTILISVPLLYLHDVHRDSFTSTISEVMRKLICHICDCMTASTCNT